MICPDEILHVDSLVFSVKQNVTAQYLISRFCPLAGVPLIHLVLGLVIKAEISIPLLKIMLRRTCPACKGPGNGDIHDTATATTAAGDRRWKFDLSDRLMERWQRWKAQAIILPFTSPRNVISQSSAGWICFADICGFQVSKLSVFHLFTEGPSKAMSQSPLLPCT